MITHQELLALNPDTQYIIDANGIIHFITEKECVGECTTESNIKFTLSSSIDGSECEVVYDAEKSLFMNGENGEYEVLALNHNNAAIHTRRCYNPSPVG